MADLAIHRISQWDCFLRNYYVYCDGRKLGFISPGENIKFEIPPGNHHLKVIVLPYFTKKLAFHIKDGETVDLTTGFIYGNFFQGLNPHALKLLPAKEFENLNYNVYPEEIIKNKQSAFFCAIGAIMVLVFTLVPGHISAFHKDFVFLIGIGQLIGSISMFNKKELPGRSFFLARPFMDGIFLLFLALFLSTDGNASILLALMSIVLIGIGYITYKANKRKSISTRKDLIGITGYVLLGVIMFAIIALSEP
jgi:hypothetical protein